MKRIAAFCLLGQALWTLILYSAWNGVYCTFAPNAPRMDVAQSMALGWVVFYLLFWTNRGAEE